MQEKHKAHSKFFLIPAALCLILLAAALLWMQSSSAPELEISADASAPADPEASAPEEFPQGTDMSQFTTFSLGRYGEYPVGSSLQRMYETATRVVLGEFTTFQEAVSIPSDPFNPIKESENSHLERHYYRFTVEQCLKGDVEPGSITVDIPYMWWIKGEITNMILDEQTGAVLKEATMHDPYEIEVPHEFYMEPVPGEKLLLFLAYRPSERIYYPAVEPYVIAFDAEGIAEWRSNLFLPRSEREELATSTGLTESGRTVTYLHSNLMDGLEVEDQISGKSLEQLLEEIAILQLPAEEPSPDEEAELLWE